MIKGLSAVSIWSAALNNLLPFYRDRLGLPVAIESPRFVVLGAPGGPSVGLGTHRDVRGRNADPARHMIGLATDDLAGWTERGKDKEAVRHEGILDSFRLTREQIEEVIIAARVKAGWIEEAQPEPEPSEAEGEAATPVEGDSSAGGPSQSAGH